MNTFIPLHRFVLLLSSLALVGLSACAWSKSDPTEKVTTHTITIKYDAAANPQWSYVIEPRQSNAKKAKVKRHDTILWVCADGDWTVFFKGATPFVDASGKDLTEVGAEAGVITGAQLAEKVKPKDEFVYGVSVMLPGATNPVVDDPRIIIEK